MRPVLRLVPLVCLPLICLLALTTAAPAVQVDPADGGEGVALGAPFESHALGISLRPPAGFKTVRKVGGEEVEFVDVDKKWALKLARMTLREPMGLETTTDPQKNLPRAGLLDVTLDRLKAAMPGAAVLRHDVINLGTSDVGMIALRHMQSLEPVLSQQAIIRANDQLYYLIALNSPGSKTAGKEPGNDPGERQAVETFREVLDSVKLLDQRPLRQEQDFRLYATRALYLNLNADKLSTALVPQQWFRLTRNGKDIGYVYTIEELGDGIPGRRRNVAAPRRVRGAAGGATGVLVGMRSRTLPDENLQIDSEAWMFCSFDRRSEQWSNLTVLRDRKNKTDDHLITLGSSSLQAGRVLDRDAKVRGEQWDKNDPGQPPVLDKEQYLLNVTHVSKTENAEPISQGLPKWYLPQALGHLLPRLLPRAEPKQFMFATYVGEARAVMHRYVDVGAEKRVTLAGETVRAIPLTDRIGVEGSVTTHYFTRDGKYVGSENADSGIVMVPTSEQKLLEIWKDADLTRPADVKDQPEKPAASAKPGGRAPAAAAAGASPAR